MNKFDSILSHVISHHPSLFLPIIPPVNSTTATTSVVKEEPLSCGPWSNCSCSIELAKETLLSVLEFSSFVLANSCNKDRYASVDRLYSLLRAFDSDIVEATVKMLVSLVVPPMSHRHLDYCAHTSMVHKNLSYCQPLFVILALASPYIVKHTAEVLAGPDFAPLDDEFEFDLLNAKLTSSFDFSQPESSNSLDENNEPLNASYTTHAQMYNDYQGRSTIRCKVDTTKSFKDTVCRLIKMHDVPPSLQFGFMWKLRVHWWLHGTNTVESAATMIDTVIKTPYPASSQNNRHQFILHLYAVVCVLLCCHPNADTLTAVFEDNCQFLRDFLFFIRTGPILGPVSTATASSSMSMDTSLGSCSDDFGNESPHSVPINIRNLSCYCVTAIVGWSDTSVSSLFSRFTWLQSELGLHKGQYMGLLPCVLRACGSYLSSTSGYTTGTFCEDPVLLRWIEALLGLLMTVVSVGSSFLPPLCDNGLMSSILCIISANCIGSSQQQPALDGAPSTVVVANPNPSPSATRSFLRVCGILCGASCGHGY